MKYVKRFLVVLLALFILLGVTLGVIGYREFKRVTDQISIQDKVAEIRDQEHFVNYKDIAPQLLQATVAIEDRRFYDHGGIDVIGLGRALLDNITAKKVVGGGSTITQQLAKNMYFGYETNITRKMGEFFVARELESKYTKKEILELYVNIINYGDNHIGIWEASQGYYQCMPSELTLKQASMLAGIPQSPSNFQLSDHLESARTRQKAVLEARVKENMITYAESVQARDH